MATIALIAAIGIFTIGVVVGVIGMVSHGIHREQQRFEEARRYRDENGLWDDPESLGYFLSDEPLRFDMLPICLKYGVSSRSMLNYFKH